MINKAKNRVAGARLSTITTPLLAACLLFISACGAPAPPADAIIGIDGEFILQKDLDQIVTFYEVGVPGVGIDTASSRALETGLFPRALAQHDFPEGLARARERMKVAMSKLKNHEAFESVEKELSDVPWNLPPSPVGRQRIDPILGAAVFGKMPGYITPEPIETTYGVVIARVDVAEPDPGPRQEAVVLTVIETIYDNSLTDLEFRTARNVKRMLSANYLEIKPGAFRFLPAKIRVNLEASRTK
ncbi:MAG: hypothetical protein HY286_01965 [Planctomycetes bacterium]|nr:hypothetical protein [Planctomycetota bacterium]